jgi:hypothetical protein
MWGYQERAPDQREKTQETCAPGDPHPDPF